MRIYNVILTIILLSTSALISGCGSQDKQKTLTPVRVITIAGEELNSPIRYTATITPYTQVELDFKVDGYIKEIPETVGADGNARLIQAGDGVSKGAVLAVVDQTSYLAKVVEADAQLKEARASLQKGTDDFKRAENLYATNSITAPDFDRSRKDYKVALAQVEGSAAKLVNAEQNLAYTSLRAPLNSVILNRDVQVGSYVRPGTQGFVLGDVTSVKALYSIPDTALTDVTLGQEIAVSTESVKDTFFLGTVTEIAPSASARTRVFNVEVAIPNPENILKPGMIASLSVDQKGGPQDVMLVPLGSVVRSVNDQNGYAVFIVQEDNEKSYAKRTDVLLGSVFGNRIAVTKGLKPADQVITVGAQIILDGAQVNIIP